MNKLIYDKPAKFWKQALPLGNGHMGIMAYGGSRHEVLTINDGTLWSGYPKNQDSSDSYDNINKVRELIFSGRNDEADRLAESKLSGGYCESFLPLGRIDIKFSRSCRSNYSRELDIDKAIYKIKGADITREALVSNPDCIAAYSIKSDKAISIEVSLCSKLKSALIIDDAINIVGQAPDHVVPNYVMSERKPIKYNEGKGMAFAMRVEAVTNGSKAHKGNKLIVSNATEITLYIATATGFKGYDSMPSTSTDDAVVRCKLKLNQVEKIYDIIKDKHIADYQSLYRRQTLQISGGNSITTDKLVKLAKKGDVDKSLIQLLYNYGKYMTIAGSREGGQALNLQGIWNNSIRPPWSSNYTTNINAEMNYWGTSAVNLPECLEPYINMIYEVSQRGVMTAKVNYGCDGFTCNHNVDIWRKTSPVVGSANYMFAPLCGVWLANELYEHLKYGKLDKFRSKIQGIMTEAVRFANDFLVEHDGYLVTAPSASAENVFIKNGKKCSLDYASSFDMAIIKQAMLNYLDMDSTSQLANDIKSRIGRLYPFKLGEYGICEYHEDYPTTQPGHRHFSPLYGFYPAKVMDYYEDRDIVEGVRKLFHYRISNIKQYFGWSGAWAINLAARLREPDTALSVINAMLSHSIFINLFDVHPPFLFQIDGNFGFVAGVNEMLVTEHNGIIELLPALPNSWGEGSVRGMVTSSGHTLDFSWKGGVVTNLTVSGTSSAKIRANKHLDNKALPHSDDYTII